MIACYILKHNIQLIAVRLSYKKEKSKKQKAKSKIEIN